MTLTAGQRTDLHRGRPDAREQIRIHRSTESLVPRKSKRKRLCWHRSVPPLKCRLPSTEKSKRRARWCRSGWEFWYCQSGPWCFWFLGSVFVSLSCVCIIIFGLLLYFMWVILVRVLQRNGTNWRVHIYELVSGIMEAEKSHNLQSVSCRPENTDGWNFSW